jgi:sigma-E factor negative regulatory protein RseA
MSRQSDSDAELVSLLVDGQLEGDAFARALADLASSDHARQQWDSYHLIGEVIRTGDVHARAHEAEFVQRLRMKLANEDNKIIAVNALNISAGGQNGSIRTAANDRWWRRASGLASIVLAGVLGWQAYLYSGSMGGAPAAGQLAQSRPATSPASQPALVVQVAADGSAAMIRDPRLDALLLAHRQFGGTSALQMPSGFLRNATFEEGKR